MSEQIERRSAMKKAALGAAAAGAVAASPQILKLSVAPAFAAAASGEMVFDFVVNGAQANAGVGTGSAGTGAGTVTSNSTTGVITYNINWSGLSGDVDAAHIHQAGAGANGGVVLPLDFTANGAAGTATDAGLAAAICAAPADYYVNVHSTTDRAGEIRGQLA